MRRLQVLLDSNMNIPAYNLTTYLVQNLFEDYQNKRSKFSYLYHEWLEKDMEKAHSILDVHIAIIYRRKEDTSVLPYLVILFANNWPLLYDWYYNPLRFSFNFSTIDGATVVIFKYV